MFDITKHHLKEVSFSSTHNQVIQHDDIHLIREYARSKGWESSQIKTPHGVYHILFQTPHLFGAEFDVSIEERLKALGFERSNKNYHPTTI